MIDLRKKELPSQLEWDGGSCAINTDFRVWITFGEMLKEKKVYLGIFPNCKAPEGEEWQLAAYRFYQCPNEVPRATRRLKTRLLDFIIDGQFIVASFQQAYGIDLTSCDMHWHRFCALLDGLPDETKMSKIMGYRGYDPRDEKRKHNEFMQEQRMRWALPAEDDEDDETGGFGALLNAFS